MNPLIPVPGPLGNVFMGLFPPDCRSLEEFLNQFYRVICYALHLQFIADCITLFTAKEHILFLFFDMAIWVAVDGTSRYYTHCIS